MALFAGLALAASAAAAPLDAGSHARTRAASAPGDVAIASDPARAAAAPLTPAPKAGVASSLYLKTDQSRLTRLGAGWAYNWSADTPPGPANPQLDWVPMVWGSGSVTPTVLAALRRDRRDRRAHALLGFNEPDSGSQSNMTPAQAAALWPKLESTGLALGSPATATPTDGWLAQFMTLVRRHHLRVNFIALHYYQDFTNPDAVAQLRSQLIDIHRRYRRPIWITEIGALDIARWGEPMMHPPSGAAAVRYMDQLLPMLNALPFVQRYAWFTDNCWNDSGCHASSLFDGRGRLTRLGSVFRSEARRAAGARRATRPHQYA